MKRRLLFYCQHVLGMGHLVRSREIVKALANFDVTFVNGGEPVDGFAFPPHVRVEQLPPVTTDSEFRQQTDDQVFATRERRLLELQAAVDPDVTVIEMFPFGRRKFARELVPMLEAKNARTRIVSSVRDILVAKRDQARHERQAVDWLNRYFDLVLVHSDQRFQSLDETFSLTAEIRCPIEYTGFVSEAPAVTTVRVPGIRPNVIASAGGGRVGFELLNAAVQAGRALDGKIAMHVFTGPYLPEAEYQQLVEQSTPWVQVERYAPDFVDRVAHADLLVSMAGYNTCMNILATGVRALVHPFTGNQNDEQSRRARKLEALGLVSVIQAGDLEPARLAARLAACLAQPLPMPASRLDLSGATRTAQSIERLF
jgi:predicted glycosyltransferase